MKHNAFLFYDQCRDKIKKIHYIMCDTSNLPKKQEDKLINKIRELQRMVHCRVESEHTSCPLCADSYYVFLNKRINQHKFQFRCIKCKFSYIVTIRPHEILCENCNGCGVTRVIVRPFIGKEYFNSRNCHVCQGNGRLDWVSRVTKVKGSR